MQTLLNDDRWLVRLSPQGGGKPPHSAEVMPRWD
jgi:hypothetical protein